MSKILIVIDMQNDFIDGVLGSREAIAIVPNVQKKIEEYRSRGDHIIFTRDTHFVNYFKTLEGKHLPYPHCIAATHGWKIRDGLFNEETDYVIQKHSFGYHRWDGFNLADEDEIELIGLCTDICVVSNALILRAVYPNTEMTVDASCCAGTTPELHKAALQVMKSCQINVIGE